MEQFPGFILLYPYPYQVKYQLFTLIVFIITGCIAYFIYSIITSFMSNGVKRGFNSVLKVTGILLLACFMFEMVVSLITIHQVNKQLGFTYATPDTPEGELFEIQKVVPGKTMDRAGLKPFDRVQMNNVNDLYKLLIDNQGKEVIIPVKRNYKPIEIKLEVPELNVPYDKVSFLF